MSNHNVIAFVNINAKITQKQKQKIYLYNKANWEMVKNHAQDMQRRYNERKPDGQTVNFIKENISMLMKNIPWKMTKSKISLP